MALADWVFGQRIPTSAREDVKIGIFAGIAAMGLDALSSAAYGPEAALAMLTPLGKAGLSLVTPITVAILALLTLLYLSYLQIISAYPANGGSYTVAKLNLGPWAGLIAGAALLIDYILNVAVGISAGVAALISAFPSLHPYTLWLCLGTLALITILNLRGTGEAGVAFAIPTYGFIISLIALVLLGGVFTVLAHGNPTPRSAPPPLLPATQSLSLWMLLRAFAAGCTAMTGVEAVSNGVTAFKNPAVRNAQQTLTIIVALLAVMLLGVAMLCSPYHVGAQDQSQPGYQSILSQLAGAIFGRGFIYYTAIVFILAALCLSANTSFVGFPRLCRLIATDDFLPHSFAMLGRRLVYSIGILFLAGSAGALLMAFDGITDRLIPLFAVGAFLAFTLSQAGMVRHWMSVRDKPAEETGRARFIPARMILNGVGAVATGATLLIFLAAKFTEGAWIVVIAIPVLLTLFRLVNSDYRRIRQDIRATAPIDISLQQPPITMLIANNWNRMTEKALHFAMSLRGEGIAVRLINVTGEEAEDEQESAQNEWRLNVLEPAEKQGLQAPKLVTVADPFRRFSAPLIAELKTLCHAHPGRNVAVIIPELVERFWWYQLMHRRLSAQLHDALRHRELRQVIVISVPWHLSDGPQRCDPR